MCCVFRYNKKPAVISLRAICAKLNVNKAVVGKQFFKHLRLVGVFDMLLTLTPPKLAGF